MKDNRITSTIQDPLLRLTDAERREMLHLLEEGKLPYEIDRQNDRFFKFLLGRRERVPLLMDLLNSIFASIEHPRIVSLTIENSELPPEGREFKLSRLDIHATDENGRKQIIELQKWKHSAFIEREIFYWAKDFSEQLGRGGKYSDLKPAISISLMGFNLYSKESRAIWDFMLMNPKTGRILSRHEVLTFVELPKFGAMLASLLKKVKTDEALTEEDRLGVWGGYFLGTDVGVEIMEALAVKDPIFQELRHTEEDYWQRPEARYFLLRERLAEMDRMAEIDDARAEGEVIGRTEGEKEGEHNKAIEIAKRMLRKGRTPEIVAEDVELPVEEIRSLNL